MNLPSQNVISSLVVFTFKLSIWGGDTTLDKPDIKIGRGGELPPEHLATLGRKNIIDSAHLACFGALKQQTRRYLESISMGFCGGRAASLEEFDNITNYLEDVKLKYEDLRRNFLANYDRWVAEWAENPINAGYKSAILSSKVPLRTVEKALTFSYLAYRIVPANENHANELNEMASGLGADLIKEIVEGSNKFFNDYLKGKSKLNVQTLKTLQAIHKKAKSLSFLRSDVRTAVKYLESAMDGYKGCLSALTGENFNKVMSAVLILCSENNFLDSEGVEQDEETVIAPVKVSSLLPTDDDLDALLLAARTNKLVESGARLNP